MRVSIKGTMLIFLGSIVLIGCAGQTIPVNSSQSNKFKGKTITYVHKMFPVRPSTLHSSSSLIAGPITNAVSNAVNSSISKERSHRDGGVIYGKPSEVLSKKIISTLVRKYKVKAKSNHVAPLNIKENPNYSSYGTDYVLNVNTGWQTQPTFAGHSVLLFNDITVVDTKSQKPILKYSCGYSSFNEGKTYRLKELLARNGQVLKQETSHAIKRCLSELKQKVLK